jgi:hypothetical protein
MMPAVPHSRSPSVLTWALGLGVVGFAAGFFGPMIFAPDANQGPLVGILFSGPGGVVLGLLLYVIFRLLGIPPVWEWRALLACGMTLAAVTLYLVMPEPAFHGYIEDVEITSCRPLIEGLDDAIRYWDGQIAKRPESARTGWQEDSRAMLQSDNGVILDVFIVRHRPLFEERKPWNTGRIVPADWQAVNASKTFYARYRGGSCANYPAATRSLQFNDLYFYGYPEGLGWPPRKASDFLGLQTLDSVPDAYRRFAG